MRIAVCDNCMEDALALKKILIGQEVSLYSDAESLLADVEENNKQYDLYLLDTLMPEGGQESGESAGGGSGSTPKSAKVETTSGSDGSESPNYTATINIAPDYKGQIKIVAKDKAGNASAAKIIGTDGNEIAGVIVEDNAPKITILADREPGDMVAAKADGTALSTNYYNTAPKLIVKVEDEETSGGSAVSAGLSSITWKIGGGAWNQVSAGLESGIKTSHSFTINELEGQTGEFSVKVKTVDQAGNETEETVTVRIKAREPVPKPTIDYINEKLTGLTPGVKYEVEGEIITADAQGCIDIREEWFGSSIQMCTKGKDDGTTLDSEEAQIALAARPDAPDVAKISDETIKGKSDGVLTGADTTMEYSPDDGGTWTTVRTDDIVNGDMTGLPSGEIRIRVKATTTAPYGVYAEVEIREGIALTVTYETNGGSSLAPVTGKSWNDTLVRPEDPVKEGYAVVGWYKETELNNIWNFEGEANADRLNGENGITVDNPGITLYCQCCV